MEGYFFALNTYRLGRIKDSTVSTRKLSELYPDMRFVFCHMNPTSTDTGVPPLVNVQNKNYSLLDRTNERDNGVNIIGTLEKIKENSELFTILHQMGVSDIRHISYYHTFEEYNAMAKSRLNLVVAPSARYSAINMEKKHHMPHVEVFTSFSLKQIKDNYERIAVALDTDCPDITEYEEQCREELAKTAQTLHNMPVIIDGEAILKPYELARTLLENNINVVRIYEQQLLDCDKENFAWIMENHPEVEFRQPQNPKASFREQYPGEPLAIGYSAAYLTYAPHVVDITTQHGLYGYQGLCDLLQMMCKATGDETDLKGLTVVHPTIYTVVGSPVPMVIGTDTRGIAHELEVTTGVPAFGFDTNGLGLYHTGVSDAICRLINRFTQSSDTKVERGINILGTTPLDFSANENAQDLKKRLEEWGFTVLGQMMMGVSIEQIRKLDQAVVNLVVTSSGLEAARLLEKKFSIPDDEES